jgi:hypothetical protein
MSRPVRRDRRKNFRLGWHLPATIYDAGRHLERPCILVDISNGGAKIAGVRAHTIPDEFRLRTRPSGTVDRAGLSGVPRIRWAPSSLTFPMARIHPTCPRCGSGLTLEPCATDGASDRCRACAEIGRGSVSLLFSSVAQG